MHVDDSRHHRKPALKPCRGPAERRSPRGFACLADAAAPEKTTMARRSSGQAGDLTDGVRPEKELYLLA